MIKEEEKVREEIALLLAKQEARYLKEYWADVKHEYLHKADKILLIKGLGIIAEDQSLLDDGECPYIDHYTGKLKANFVKLIKREEKHD